MNAAVERVMRTYGMMVSLDPGQEQAVREKVLAFLSGTAETDEQRMTVAALRFARSIQIEAL
jgi:hypothetical protein